LEAVLWRLENEERIAVEEAIEELRKSSFIEVLGEKPNTLIYTPLAISIFGKSELEVYPQKLKILDDRKYLMEFGAMSQNSLSNGSVSKIERENFLC
jgi:hypothetical protein